MLDLMRRHAKSWIIKILLGLVALAMVGFFGYSGVSFLAGRKGRAVTVNGDAITFTQVQRSEARLRERHGPGWWSEFTKRSAYEAQARRAKVAELKLKEIIHQAAGKLEALDRLLREHPDRQMLVFTAHNRFAYQIARRHLIPVITHQTKAAERKAVLEGFRAGTYRAIATSKVLNEGVDVPEAKIAAVLGGSASAREYVQRLGRVLRKRGNAQAVLYEVIARKTVDERIAQRRKPKK